MTYVLIALRPGREFDEARAYGEEHEPFIDSLIERSVVLLGGDFASPLGNVHAAYLLRCNDVDEGRAIAQSDPLVRGGVFEAEAVEWQLVGIDPRAIEPGLSI
jgi:uncharacterized protein YciI